MEALVRCSPSVPLVTPEEVPFFYWALMTLDSLTGGCCVGRGISPSSEPSDVLPIFLFFLRASTAGVWVRAGVSGRGTIRIAGVVPPAWAVSNANKSGVFPSRTMAYGTFDTSWLVLMEAGPNDGKWWLGDLRYLPDKRLQSLYLTHLK